MSSSQALVGFDREQSHANANDDAPQARVAELEARLQAQEPVIGAALLVAAAFRLRDEEGLIATLRLLAQALGGLEIGAAADAS